MKVRRPGWRALLLVAVALGAGCAPAWVPVVGKVPDMQVQSVRSIKTVTIRRIAVMPMIEAPASPTSVVLEGSGDTVTAELQSRLALEGGWRLISQSEVADALQKLPPPNPMDLKQTAIELGKKVAADGVLYGKLEDFRERVGTDFAAASPAAVEFTLNLVDVRSGQLIWHARYDKQQKALTENVFNLASFIKNEGRWVRAHEIAADGVDEAVQDLHTKLNLEKNVAESNTDNYQKFEQGERRFDR